MEQPLSHEELIEALAGQTRESGKFWNASQEFVPGGLLSLARKFKPYPFYTQRGEGPYIWDVDENRYIDCAMSYGVLLLGHRPSVVEEAIKEQLGRGTTYGTPHPLEVKFVEQLVKSIPCADRALLCNSGTEATMQGIRVMRAYTGKQKVAKFEGAYHGWHDYASWSINCYPDDMGPPDRPNPVPESAGIPDAIKDTIVMLPFNEHAFDLIEEHADELAGVMVEPVLGTGTIPATKEFLQNLREVTEKNGVMLMFDEVITGFRLALGGAQEFYGVIPDIATYGKIIGGGLPAGAVGCSKEVMEKVLKAEMSLAVAGTFSGNPMTLAAGTAMLKHLHANPQIYKEMTRKGDRLRNGFNDWAKEKGYPAFLTGVTSMFQMHMKDSPINQPRDLIGQYSDAMSDLQLYLRLNGVFIPWLHLAFISNAHSDEDIEEIIRVHQVSTEACLKAHKLI